MPFQHFDEYQGPDNSGRTIHRSVGWAAWTAAGAFGLSRTQVGRRLFGYVRHNLTSGAGLLRTGQTLKRALQPSNISNQIGNMLDRPMPLREAMETAEALLTSGGRRGVRGLPRRNIMGALGAAAGEPGAVTVGQLLRGTSFSGLSPRAAQQLSDIRSSAYRLRWQMTTSEFRGLQSLPVSGVLSGPRGLRDVRWRQAGAIPHALELFDLEKLLGHTPSLPIVGEMSWLSRPLKWMAEMMFPIDILRDQPLLKVFKGPSLGGGRHPRFLYRATSGGGSARNVVEKINFRESQPIGPPWATRSRSVPISGRGLIPTSVPGWDLRAKVSPIRDPNIANVNVRLVSASSSIGKGFRIRTRDYAHSLDDFFRAARPKITRATRFGRLVEWMDEFGLGPHLTAPSLKEGLAFGKLGLPQTVWRNLYKRAHGVDPLPHWDKRVKAADKIDKFVWTPTPSLTRKGLQGASDFFSYLMMRPMALLEELTGLGIRPGIDDLAAAANRRLGTSLPTNLGVNPLTVGAGIFGKVILPGYGVFQGARYANYLAGQAFGKSPLDLVLDTYSGLQVGYAKLRELSGVQEATSGLEERFPGLVSSPLSAGLRGYYGGLGGAILAGKVLPAGAGIRNFTPLIGAGLGALLASDPRERSGYLQRIYSGEEPVAIRRSRFWEMGRDPWFGADVQYYRPHGIAMMKSDFQEKALYGSESDYWKYGTMFPSPHNLFGLLPLIRPNVAEDRNIDARPYPIYGGFGGNIPIIGSTVEAATGFLFGTREHPRLRESMAAYADPRRTGFERGFAMAMPGAGLAGAGEGVVSPYRADQLFGRQMAALQDWFGMPGFMFGAIKENLVGGGRDLFAGERQLERASRLTSPERWLYEVLNLGGAFGQSEIFRRFITRTNRQVEQVNPIPNQMPFWVPGSRSGFRRDRDFYADLSTGDPYTKIPMGEARLPGPGYEALRPLHSETPGVYDPVDRFMILADVAPFSESYKHHATIVDMWMKAGAIDQSWTRRIVEAKGRIQQRMDSRALGTPNLMASPGTEAVTITPTQVLGSGGFRTAEHPGVTFRLAGLDDRRERPVVRALAEGNAATVAEARLRVQEQRASVRDRLRGMLGQPTQAFVSADQASRFSGGRTNVIIPGLNEDFFRSDIGNPTEQGMAANLRAGPIGRGLGNLWYGVASQDLPFPFGWPKNKLLPVRDPVDDYYQFQVRSQRVAMWEDPVQGYIKPWISSWADWLTPGDHVPDAHRQRLEVDRRFGALEYIKAQGGLVQARALGDQQLVDYFSKMSKKTPAGLNAANPRDAAMYGYGMLAPWERKYLDPLRGLATTEQRERALGLVSPSMGYLLTNAWKQELPRGTGFVSPGMQRAEQTFEPSRFQSGSLAGVAGARDLPRPDWAGWDPRVNLDAVKIRYLNNEGTDIHYHGLWESQQRQFDRQFPDLDIPQMMDLGPINQSIFEKMSARRGLTQRSMSAIGYGGPSSFNLVYRQSNMLPMAHAFRNADYRFMSNIYGVN